MSEEFILNVEVGNGKYTVQQGADGRLVALRYGEKWRDCVGDGLIYALAGEVQHLRDGLKKIANTTIHSEPFGQAMNMQEIALKALENR